MEDVACGQEACEIAVLMGAPQTALHALQNQFEYITGWILPDGLQNALYNGLGIEAADFACDCEEEVRCNDTSIECACVIDHGYYYDSQSRLMLDDLPTRYALYECSPACACNMTGTCVNRITQGSFSTPCSVRWTDTRGFGLFAETDIAKGSFLCCYVGEVISTSERKNRWMKQDETKQSNYTLVLREVMQVRNSREVLTTAIDARLKGNIGHFLNHACPPLTTHVVLPVRTVGTLIPRPAFFAVRDIKAGEELTWDYEDAGGETWLFGKGQRADPADTPAIDGRTQCHCGSPRCRGWLAFDPSL